MKDNEIIDLYWARNEKAIAATKEKYGNYCHTIAFNILHNNEDAEECTNDTYLGAWNSIPPQRPNPLSTYLGKIARNFALNRYKQYTAQKRGLGQVTAVLSELEECVPAETTVEQAVEEKVLVSVIDRFPVCTTENQAYYFYPQVLASMGHTEYCRYIRNEREQGCIIAVPHEKRFEKFS